MAWLTACNPVIPTVEPVKTPILTTGNILPVPTGEIILQVNNLPNGTENITFDQAIFEQLGTVAYTVMDPWLQQEVRYTGVLLTDLLAMVGAENTVEIQAIALDGYNAPIPATIFNEYPILIAYQADGVLLDVATNGPTRIIFPYDDYPDITEARNLSVWNLEAIEIK